MQGHEIWQNANLRSQGLAPSRFSTQVSRENPVIVLSDEMHANINRAQSGIDAAKQSAIDNINANYELLIQHGVPKLNAEIGRIWALNNLERSGGK